MAGKTPEVTVDYVSQQQVTSQANDDGGTRSNDNRSRNQQWNCRGQWNTHSQNPQNSMGDEELNGHI